MTATATDSALDRPDLPLEPGHAAVVGLQWGDEGKGQIVDLLTERYDLVARYNGGNNAGHSVHVGDEKFALHLLPSGITYPDKTCVVGNGVVVDPSPETGILKELATLAQRGITPGPRLRISERAHVVMPYHKREDALLEAALAAASGSEKIGTTGRGIGPCYADKAHRSTAIRVGELLETDVLTDKLARIVKLKNATLGALASVAGEDFEPFDANELTRQAIGWGQQLKEHICDTRLLLHDAEQAGKSILFEGANAALLDVDHGTYPYVTSSTTSALGVATGSGLAPRKLNNVLGVAKAYVSRVGGGPHPTEQDNPTGQHIQKVGNEFGTTTGRPRRCGWFDASAVKYTAQLNGLTGLIITGLSVLADLDELNICVGYDYRGQRLPAFPPEARILEQATPVYETLPGFKGPTGGVSTYDDLPDNARKYIDFIEGFVGTPVVMVCVGPKRSQTLVRGK